MFFLNVKSESRKIKNNNNNNRGFLGHDIDKPSKTLIEASNAIEYIELTSKTPMHQETR